ncbi:MAG: ABC transporter permease [Acidimicrobiia bacterium]|nr:ABC transporter permease [Acidimicrobiia bacterium]
MSPLTTMRLVAVRELVERAKSRAFLLSTGFILVLVTAAILLPAILGDDGENVLEVATAIPISSDVVAQFEAATDGDPSLVVEVKANAAEVETALEDREADVGIIAGPEVLIRSGDPGANVQLLTNVLAFQKAVAGLSDLGLTVEDIAPLLAADVPITALEEGASDEDFVLAAAGVILLYVTILTYGQWVVLGVVEEKTSRVVEVVLGAVRPRHLLAGKVIGIGLLGVGQVILIGVIALGAASLGGESVPIPDAAPTAFATVLLWYIVGFAIYGVMFAAAGALASRQEEAANATFPFTILLTVGYFISFSAVEESNLVVRLLSFLPPFAPITMQLRMVNGDAAVWEVAVSLALAVAMVYLVIRLGERFYRGAILGQGSKLKWREAWRSAEM